MFSPDDYLMGRSVFYSRLVIPAQAGTHKCFFVLDLRMRGDEGWMPAYAGMTGKHPDSSIIYRVFF
jgi:hypothetical protein